MKNARTPRNASRRRFQVGKESAESEHFDIPGYSGPMAALLDIIRNGPELLGLSRTAVLLFIAERTIAYRKFSDAPSLSQIVDGVYSRRGSTVEWVRHGCGLRQSAAKEATASLVSLGLLEKLRRSNAKKGNLSTQYEIRWAALRAYFAEKSGTKVPPLGRQTAKGSPKPLETSSSETPLAATRLSPSPPNGQEQYLDNNSASKSTAAARSAFDLSLGEANGQADHRLASAKSAADSPDEQSACAANAENHKADSKADAPASPAGEEKPLPVNAKPTPPWAGLDVTNVGKWLSAFMDGEQAPQKLVRWIVDLAEQCRLSADDIRSALEAAWRRRAAPGQKNAPRSWNWFYEVLRAAFIPGYAARLPEAPAAPHPAHQASAEQLQRGIEALDGPLVASVICPRCGGEIRQYSDHVEGTCTCGRAKPITRVTQMPTPGKRRVAGGSRK